MDTSAGELPPRSFWVISAVALLWNLLGVAAYVSQVTMTPAALAALPEAEQALYADVPAWATSAFALAVNGGALGCLLLLFRKAWAIPVLIISLAGVIVQMYHSLFIAGSIKVYGPGGTIMPIMVVIIAVFLVWYANNAKGRRWIG